MKQDPCGQMHQESVTIFPMVVDFLTCSFILRAFLSPVINQYVEFCLAENGQNVCG